MTIFSNKINELIIELRSDVSQMKIFDSDRPDGKAIKNKINRLDNETLKIVYKEKIQFVSNLALCRLARRGVNLDDL